MRVWTRAEGGWRMADGGKSDGEGRHIAFDMDLYDSWGVSISKEFLSRSNYDSTPTAAVLCNSNTNYLGGTFPTTISIHFYLPSR